jgi:hypothetical protein
MKLKLMVVAALAACSAAAMPTNDEIKKANADVMMAFRKQLAAWQGGSISDRDLSALMLMNAGKYKDEARHYVCLQAAFAGAVRAGDAVLAANAIEKIKAKTKDFGAAEERKLVKKALEKTDAEKSNAFLRDLEVERAKIVYATPISDAAATTIAKMKMTVVPSVTFKPPTTLADAVAFLNKASKEYDPSGSEAKGVNFLVDTRDTKGLPGVPMIRTGNISLYSLLKLVVDAVGYDFKVNDDIVVVFKNGNGATSADTVAVARMKQIILPTLNIKPPATLKDVVELLRKASMEHDPRKDGANFVLEMAEGEQIPAVPRIRAGQISVYNALDLVLESVGCDFKVKGESIVIFKKGGEAKKK